MVIVYSVIFCPNMLPDIAACIILSPTLSTSMFKPEPQVDVFTKVQLHWRLHLGGVCQRCSASMLTVAWNRANPLSSPSRIAICRQTAHVTLKTGTGTGWPCIHKLGVYVLCITWTPGNMCSAMHSWQQHQMPNAGLTGHPAMCMAAFDELSSAPEVVATASDGHPPEDQQPFV